MAHTSRHFHPLRPRSAVGRKLETISHDVTAFSGSSWAFAGAAGVILIWLATGPFFHFSDTWQLVVNTGTTVVTFLMVFLIQRSQNKDSLALQLKLNELVAAVEGASNRLIDIEDLTEQELRVLHSHYQRLAEMAKEDLDLKQSHSIEEAVSRHRAKAAAEAEEDVAEDAAEEAARKGRTTGAAKAATASPLEAAVKAPPGR